MAIAMMSPMTVSIQREMYHWMHSHTTATLSGTYEILYCKFPMVEQFLFLEPKIGMQVVQVSVGSGIFSITYTALAYGVKYMYIIHSKVFHLSKNIIFCS